MRFLRFTLMAGAIAILPSPLPRTAHADEGTGQCRSWSHADAYASDGSGASGSADDGVQVGGYTRDNCLGLAETDAIFAAGKACENAGVPAGLVTGLGTATVSWCVTWQDYALSDPWRSAPLDYYQQQYDCGDTFY